MLYNTIMNRIKDFILLLISIIAIIVIAYFNLIDPIISDMNEHGTSFIISLIRVGGGTALAIFFAIWFKSMIG